MGQDDKVLHRSGIKMEGYSGYVVDVLLHLYKSFFHLTAGLYLYCYLTDKTQHSVT